MSLCWDYRNAWSKLLLLYHLKGLPHSSRKKGDNCLESFLSVRNEKSLGKRSGFEICVSYLVLPVDSSVSLTNFLIYVCVCNVIIIFTLGLL